MKIKSFLAHVFLLGLLSACVAPPNEAVSSAYVSGILVVGKPVSGVCNLTPDASFARIDSIWLDGPGLRVTLNRQWDCYSAANTIVQPNSAYILTVFEGLEKRIAHINTPFNPIDVTASEDAFQIGLTEAMPVTQIEWVGQPGYRYAVQLEVLDLEAPIIPFDGIEGGKFGQELSGFIPENGVALLNTDFSHYGLHRLTIYTVTEPYPELLSFGNSYPGAPLTGGPTTFDHGPGFVHAAGATEIMLEVLP